MYTVDTKELRKCMIGAGYNTIGSLAEASGVNRNTIGKLLNSELKPSTDVIERIAFALKMDGLEVGKIFFANELS